MDLNVWLYFEELNVRRVGVNAPDRDIFFASKGHDVPGLCVLRWESSRTKSC